MVTGALHMISIVVNYFVSPYIHRNNIPHITIRNNKCGTCMYESLGCILYHHI